jgi:hypothetical protein
MGMLNEDTFNKTAVILDIGLPKAKKNNNVCLRLHGLQN